VQDELNALIARDFPVAARWISDEALAAQPELVKTMRVKPPSGQGRVRVIDVDGMCVDEAATDRRRRRIRDERRRSAAVPRAATRQRGST